MPKTAAATAARPVREVFMPTAAFLVVEGEGLALPVVWEPLPEVAEGEPIAIRPRVRARWTPTRHSRVQ